MLKILRSIVAAGLLTATNAPAAPPTLSQNTDVRIAVDRELSEAVRAGRTSAAIAALVENGRIVFLKGYGWEDVNRRRAVAVASTRFQIASISKTVTALALAQLHQAGAIRSFDDPANAYLKGLRLPDWNGRALSIRNLATHSAGFDEAAFGDGTPRPVGFRERPDALQRRIPRLFRPPGGFSAYSNMSASVLGRLVGDVSAAGFENYVHARIFVPIGMTGATFVDRTDARLARPFDPARGYTEARFATVPSSVAAGGVLATGTDMALYMSALLNPAPNTAVTSEARRDLFTPLHQNHPFGSVHALLYEIWHIGPSTLYVHGGSQSGTECMMALRPERRTGLFWCFTGYPRQTEADPAPLSMRVLAPKFLGALLAAPAKPPTHPASVQSSQWRPAWDRYVGEYVSMRRFHHGVGRLDNYINPSTMVFLRGPVGLREARLGDLREVGPASFQGDGMADRLVFVHDPYTGREVVTRGVNPSAFQKSSLLDSPSKMMRVAGVALGLALTGLLFPLWRSATGGLRRIIPAMLTAIVPVTITALIFGTDMLRNAYIFGDNPALTAVRILAYGMLPVTVLMLLGLRSVDLPALTLTGRLARAHHAVLAVTSMVWIFLLAVAGQYSFTLY